MKIIAPLLSIDGYGQSAELIFLALRKLGVNIWFDGHDWLDGKFSHPDLLKRRTSQPFQVNIVYHLPITAHKYTTPTNKVISFSMWETTKLPPMWTEALNGDVDDIFVPCRFVHDLYRDNGINKDIKIVPIGVDVDFFKYKKRELKKPFTFLIVGKLDNRKNYQTAIEAFIQEFGEDEDVKLIVKTRANHELEKIEHPKIEYIEQDITKEELRDLYYRSNVFLFPTRGEGFGMPPREAMATGIPCIITPWSGTKEISDKSMAYPLPYNMVPATYPGIERFGFKKGQSIGLWADPDFMGIRKTMRRCYNRPKETILKGLWASKFVREKYHPMVGAKKLLEYVKEMMK